MTRFYPKFYITLGVSGEDSIYIKNSSDDWIRLESQSFFRVYKALNQMSEFEIHFSDIETSEKGYVKEQAEVLFFSDNTLILKGKIQKVTYETGYECIVTGNGMEVDLLNKEYSNSTRNADDPKRVEYSNVSAQTVANELLSTDSDGASPWDMTPASTGLFDTDYGNISVRYEFANKLNCLGKLSESIDYEWWVEVDSKDYSIQKFNIAPLKGAQTSVKTYAITGDDANCSQTSQEKDVTNMANKIEMLGYGDGINQLSTATYAASTTYSTLSADITSASTTISLADAGDFASSGTIRIAEEQITYTGKSTNDLTGCTRGANSTTAKAHKLEVYTEKYVAIASAEAASPVGLYGILESTLTDTSVINEETLELMASKELLNRMTPIVRISLIPNEAYSDVAELVVGDKVTVTDAESDISGDYRIVAINYEDNYGNLSMEIQVSNRSLTFIEQMEKQREATKNLSVYAQGATNIYAINNYENADASNYLNLRFFIPNEAIAINKVLLNFKLKDYRAYTTSTVAGSSHSHNLTISSSGAHSHDTSISAGGGHDHAIGYMTADWPSSGYPQSSDVGTTVGSETHTHGAETSDSVAHTHTGQATDGESAHTHGQTYAINETSLTSPSVDLYTGEDGGSMTKKATYTTDQTDIDVTTEVTTVGAGSWVNLQFRPNKAMRIEANAYIQIFIESK